MVMQSMKDGRLGLGLSLPCSLLLTGSMKGLFLQRLSEMGLSVSGDSGTEHLAFPVAVHAVMHNLFLSERCVITTSYITGNVLCEW